jgi:hypothetical protein
VIADWIGVTNSERLRELREANFDRKPPVVNRSETAKPESPAKKKAKGGKRG